MSTRAPHLAPRALQSAASGGGGRVVNEDERRAELRRRLWRDQAEETASAAAADDSSTVVEQYKLYVEMADRVSQRRALANTFFLSLNTAIFALIGASLGGGQPGEPWWLLIPLVALLGECFAWFYLVRSYRLLNGAKYEVIGAIEERLPASPYWRAEWWALGEGKDPRRYWPLSHIEQWIPGLFALAYITGFVALVAAG